MTTLDDAVLQLQRPVEAVLFVASEALSIQQLAKLLHAEEREIAAVLDRKSVV